MKINMRSYVYKYNEYKYNASRDTSVIEDYSRILNNVFISIYSYKRAERRAD